MNGWLACTKWATGIPSGPLIAVGSINSAHPIVSSMGASRYLRRSGKLSAQRRETAFAPLFQEKTPMVRATSHVGLMKMVVAALLVLFNSVNLSAETDLSCGGVSPDDMFISGFRFNSEESI